MSSPPVRVVYKLVQQGVDGITRRLTFDSQPTWVELAHRVHDLYFIPLDDIGLVYVDEDEITVSSNPELQDYHDSLRGNNASTHKFLIRNLVVSGARRPPSDSSGSSFSHLKYSPDPGPPEPPVFSLPRPSSHERGRSSSPVILSESRVLARQEEEELGSVIQRRSTVHDDNGSDVDFPRPRSRSFSPSFIKMGSPRSFTGRLSRPHSREPSIRNYSASPHSSVIHTRPPSVVVYDDGHPRGLFDIAYIPQPAPPSINAPEELPVVDEQVDYMTTEEVIRFATPISRPPSGFSQAASNFYTQSQPSPPESPVISFRAVSPPMAPTPSPYHPIPETEFILSRPPSTRPLSEVSHARSYLAPFNFAPPSPLSSLHGSGCVILAEPPSDYQGPEPIIDNPVSLSRPPSAVIYAFSRRSRSRSPSHSRNREDYLTATRDNLVKTTLEQLRDVSQGIMASLRQEMDMIKDETTQSIQQSLNEMKERALDGAQASLDHVRNEMDIVKVEARELLEVRDKLTVDVMALNNDMTNLRKEIEVVKGDLKRIATEVSQERESMEDEMRDMISQLRRERALREREREGAAAAAAAVAVAERQKALLIQRPGYNPSYIPVPPPVSRPQIDPQPSTQESQNPFRRSTWWGPTTSGPPRPPLVPPPPPPPPPPPASSSQQPREAYPAVLFTDPPAGHSNERGRPRHLPRPPAPDDTNGNGSNAESASETNTKGFPSIWSRIDNGNIPPHLRRANTLGRQDTRVPIPFGYGGRGWNRPWVHSHDGRPVHSDGNGDIESDHGPHHHHHHHPHNLPHHLHHPRHSMNVTHPLAPSRLRRTNSVPTRINATPFVNGGLRFSIVPEASIPENQVPPSDSEPAVPSATTFTNASELSSKPSTETMSAPGTRIERSDVEEARRIYKTRKAAWRKQRDEARKAFMMQMQNGGITVTEPGPPKRVRPFDLMAIPAEMGNPNGNGSMRMPGALPGFSTTPQPPVSSGQQQPEGPTSAPNSRSEPLIPLPPHPPLGFQAQQQSSAPQRWPSVRFAPSPPPSPRPEPQEESSDDEAPEVEPRPPPLRPSVNPIRFSYPTGFEPLDNLSPPERQLKNVIQDKLNLMGFGSVGFEMNKMVEQEVRKELQRVHGRPHSADTVSMMERLVEHLLMNPNNLSNVPNRNGTNVSGPGPRSRSISPQSRRLISELVAADSASGPIPGQWSEV
ncbi:hypothetical protein Clacol_004154 [Clathrus columnatus]|uniref:PB1 domain-containing protein n=1 Tax=Clathrus columnatus TaxID=1419009 RepID=A0AAV5A6L7_9AGAM|nr:hypothetical protein Clacol_004154 [Clathrus columnatus]